MTNQLKKKLLFLLVVLSIGISTITGNTSSLGSYTGKQAFTDSGEKSVTKTVSLTLVTLENCTPGTWVGMVRWLNNKTDYEDLPDAEIKRTGKLNIWLPPGDYAITHFKPRVRIKIQGGGEMMTVSKIIEFREVTVGNDPITFSFGCN